VVVRPNANIGQVFYADLEVIKNKLLEETELLLVSLITVDKEACSRFELSGSGEVKLLTRAVFAT
jgi:hypothetical protein